MRIINAIISILIILPFLVFTTPVYGASGPTEIGTETTHEETGTTNTTTTHTVPATGGNRALIALITQKSNVYPSGVTWNGDAMTFIGSNADPCCFGGVSAYYIVNPDTGNNTAVVTFASSQVSLVTLVTLQDVDQGTPIGTVAKNNNGGATGITVTLASMGADSLAFYHGTVGDNASSLTQAAGQDEQANVQFGGAPKYWHNVGSEIGEGTPGITWTTSTSSENHGFEVNFDEFVPPAVSDDFKQQEMIIFGEL